MSAKDNFAQAMKELLNGDETGKETEDKKAAPSSFSSFSQPEARPPKAPAPEKRESVFGGGAPAAAPAPAAEKPAEPAKEEAAAPAPKAEEPKAEAPAAPAPAPAHAAPAPAPKAEEPKAETPSPAAAPHAAAPEAPAASAPAPATEAPAPAAAAFAPAADNGDVTVIAKGTVIVGDVSTMGGMRCQGEVKGNITVAKKLELTGKVIGDIKAEDVAITASSIKGNVTVKNFFLMDGATTVVGDVSGKNAQVDGKIKGNLTVEERGHFESHATLVGNLVSGTVIIDEGAMLKGDIAITNAQNENINVDEPDFDIEI